MKQLTHIKNKTYIIKQRGRYSKEYLEKLQKCVQYYRSYPSKFMEECCGIKLPLWQKMIVDSKILLKFKTRCYQK